MIVLYPPSPPKPTHTNRTIDKILSSISSTSYDFEDEHSDASNSSSVEDLTHTLYPNAPRPPNSSLETAFYIKLPINVQNPESNTRASLIANRNLHNYIREQLAKIGAIKDSFGKDLPTHPTEPISEPKTVPKTTPSITQNSPNILKIHVTEPIITSISTI
jgi:hypothetical protein